MSLSMRNNRNVHQGMTIVELLVVLGVLAILLGIAATAVKTGTRGKKQREAARQVNAYIAAAQAKALQINRPVGIEIARNLIDVNDDGVYTSGTDTGIGNASLLMYTIETPPPYAGDTVNAQIGISVPMTYGPGSMVTLDDTSTSVFTSASVLVSNNTTVGVRLAYRGPIYSATVVNNSPLQIEFQIPPHDRTVFDLGTVPCQIFLPPIRTSATPLQLPTDTCIDLTCSGVANTGNEFANWAVNLGATPPATGSNDFSIRFLFSPRGNVQSVNYNGNWLSPTGNIHMLVGKFDQAVDALDVMGTDGINEVLTFSPGTPVNYVEYLTPPDPNLKTNLADATAMWVSVNFQTGQITTTRNKLIPNSFISGISALTQVEQNQAILAESRDFARSVLIVQGQGDNQLMLCLPHPNSTGHRSHHGVTLIEVMMSTMVISLGILGLVALIPLGTHLTERGVRADRIAALGPRAFHEARARGVFNPNKWIDPTGSGASATTGGDNPLPLRQPYMIDPMFFGANGTHNSRRFFPYPATFAVGQTMPASDIYTVSKPMRMHRLSIMRDPNATTPIALSLPQAKATFQSNDDLAFERPNDGELPSFQRFFQRGSPGVSVKRQAAGEYTWMVMLTPEPFALSNVSQVSGGLDNNDGRYLHPPIDTTTASGAASQAQLDATLSNAVTDEYMAHIIIARNRQANLPIDDISTIDTESEKINERILEVSNFFAPGGYSTGEVELKVSVTPSPGAAKEAEDFYLKVSNGDWICLARRMPVAGNSQASFPRGDVYHWYKVVMVDDIVEISDGYTRRLTVNGPDWPTSDPSYAPTHAIIVDGVVGVYSKRVRLETQSPWSP